MSKNINLLQKKGKNYSQDDQILLIVQRLSLFALIIVIFSTLTLFALNYDTTLPQLKRQQNASLTNLSLLQAKTAKILFIKSRLVQIQSIMDKRNNYESVLNQITQLTPKDVSIDELSIMHSILTITYSSKSLASLSNILDTMTSMVDTKQTLQTLHVDDLSGDTQTYILTLSAKLL